MDALTKSLPLEEIKAMLEKYEDNPDLKAYLEEVLKDREAQAESEQAKAKFEAKIANLTKLPAPPEGVNNVYMAYRDVEVPTGPAEEIDDPNNPGQKVTRTPVEKVKQWVVEINKAMKITGGSSKASSKGTRTIKVYKRDGLNLVDKGEFANAQEACNALNIPVAGDSARRVLTKEGYIVE